MKAATALVCFVSLVLPALGWCQTPTEVRNARNQVELERLFRDSGNLNQRILTDSRGGTFETSRERVAKALEFRESLKSEPRANAKALSERVRAIKANPVYRTDERPAEENWLGATISDFFRRIEKLFQRDQGPAGGPAFNIPFLGAIGQLLIYVVIGALVILVGWLLFWAISKRDPRRRVKAGGLLDEEEEALASDEWLDKADGLIAQGEHRLAMRCLYLGSLTLCDEHRVAEFRREQTNWEHHDRIMRSKRRPETVSFTEATKRFDLVWYGERGEFEAEARWMREFYLSVRSGLGQVKAA